jgi:hypothetical protein
MPYNPNLQDTGGASIGQGLQQAGQKAWEVYGSMRSKDEEDKLRKMLEDAGWIPKGVKGVAGAGGGGGAGGGFDLMDLAGIHTKAGKIGLVSKLAGSDTVSGWLEAL